MATEEPAIPTGVYEQPEKSTTNAGGSMTIVRNFKGPYSDLVTFANNYSIGETTHAGVPLQTVKLDRIVGPNGSNLGTLELTFAAPEQGQSGSGGSNAVVIGTSWQMRHTQKQVSLYRYCGASDGASANRGRIEQWRRGTDAYLFQNFQWRDKVGALHTLTQRDQLLAAKFRAGFETVMRFYPTIQKVTIYGKGKISNIGAKLAHIDTPSDAPDGWTATAASWLKIGDDLTFDSASGKQTRTESWLGEEGFDQNLYGDAPNRWAWGSV